MTLFREEILLRTEGETQVVDLTPAVREVVAKCTIRHGTVHVFAPGATAGITTIEYESGCVQDLQEAFERIAPRHGTYEHNKRWGDGNGFSHVRAALLGPSLSVPLMDGEVLVGTWQQVVLVDFDNGPRDRRVVVAVSGE